MSNAPSDAAFERLPKWAQHEITRLERNEKYLAEKLAAGPAESDTFCERGMQSQPLGVGENIRFKFKDKVAPNGHQYTQDITIRIATDHRERRYLDVHGDETLIVVPKASNSVEIFLRDK